MSSQTQVPRPDDNEALILRFYAERDTPIIIGPCAQYDEGRCEGTLVAEDDTLVEDGDMVTLACTDCNVVSFRTTGFILERARAELADYHYQAQFDGGDVE